MLLGQTVRGVAKIYMIFVMLTLGFFGFAMVFEPFDDMTVSAAPATHYVSPDGAGNFTTIQDAVNNTCQNWCLSPRHRCQPHNE